MIAPYLVSRLADATGKTVYTGDKVEIGQVMSKTSARQIKEMMAATVQVGTSRKGFSPL